MSDLFFPTDGSTFGFSSVHRFAAAYELGFYFFKQSRDRYNAEYALQFAFKKQTEQLNNNNNNNKSKRWRKM